MAHYMKLDQKKMLSNLSRVWTILTWFGGFIHKPILAVDPENVFHLKSSKSDTKIIILN